MRNQHWCTRNGPVMLVFKKANVLEIRWRNCTPLGRYSNTERYSKPINYYFFNAVSESCLNHNNSVKGKTKYRLHNLNVFLSSNTFCLNSVNCRCKDTLFHPMYHYLTNQMVQTTVRYSIVWHVLEFLIYEDQIHRIYDMKLWR